MLLLPLLFLGQLAASDVFITFPNVSDGNKIGQLHEFYQASNLVERVANLGTQALTDLLDYAPNLVISPLNVFSCLDILYLGAAGETEKELGKIVNHGEYAGLIKRTMDSLQGVTHASAVFFDNDIVPNAGFVQDSFAKYQTEIHNVDFARDPSVTLDINRWIAQKTNGTITDMLREKLDPSTRAVVVNALLFRGKWLHPFAPQLTSIGKFSIDEENFEEVPLMHADLHIPLIKRGRYIAIGLPYKENDLVMYALLPRDPGTRALKEVLRSLSPGDLRSFPLVAATRSIKIVLPKFRHVTRLSMKDPLINQGLKTSFLPGIGNFSNFSDNKVNDIFISNLYHSVFFEVNEEETVASAAASAILTKSGRFEFVATRPFIFLVVDKNGLLLFAGVITRPKYDCIECNT